MGVQNIWIKFILIRIIKKMINNHIKGLMEGKISVLKWKNGRCGKLSIIKVMKSIRKFINFKKIKLLWWLVIIVKGKEYKNRNNRLLNRNRNNK